MKSTVRLQYWRLATVYGLIGLIVAWQWHFIKTGVESNPYLNVIIIAVFAFGSLKLVLSLTQLRKEGIAFEALEELWADIQGDRAGGEVRLSRFERAFEPGLVFRRPKLLGHIFELVLEELMRTRQMRISVSTMQNLMHAVDGRISMDRSLVSYLSGLCIFLGLIGTFIGLMEMVQSVGGIIGTVAGDPNAGGNPTETVQRLISSLQAPLNGMATGFSSSLFGLFSSLILGLNAKFVSQATGALRDEFEAWLAGISEIEGKEHADAGSAAPGASAGQLGGLAVSLLAGMRRSQDSLDQVAASIRMLGERQTQHVELLGSAVEQMQHFAAQEARIRQALSRTDAIWQQLGKVREDVHRMESVVSGRVADGFEAVSTRLSADSAVIMGALQQLAGGQAELGQHLDAAAAGLGHAVANVGDAVARTDETIGSIERALGEARSQQARDAGHTAQVLAQIAALAREGGARAAAAEAASRSRIEGLDHVAARMSETSTALQALIDIAGHQPDAMAAALRPVLAEGFASLARSMADGTEILGSAVAGLAAQQTALAATLDATGPAKALGTELREVARTIEGSMTSGFGDLARSVEGIFLSYADLARRSAADAAIEAQPEPDGDAGAGEPLSADRLSDMARRRHPARLSGR
jgi:ABC-type transporter Mla subunit MlaD